MFTKVNSGDYSDQLLMINKYSVQMNFISEAVFAQTV